MFQVSAEKIVSESRFWDDIRALEEAEAPGKAVPFADRILRMELQGIQEAVLLYSSSSADRRLSECSKMQRNILAVLGLKTDNTPETLAAKIPVNLAGFHILHIGQV